MAKGNPLLSVRIPPELDDRLNTTVQQTGGTRSDIAIAALTAYLMPNGGDEVAALRRRIEALEKRIGG
jgi:predicted transcriptional regulator